MPEVRRHGSARGRGRPGGAHGLELLQRPLQLALLGEQVGEHVAQLDQHLDVERGVDQPVLGQRAARPVGGAVPLLQRQPEQLLDQRAEPDPGQPGQPAGQLGVEQPRRAPARPRPGRPGPGWRRAAPTPVRSGPGRARTGRCPAGSGRPARCRRPRGAAAPGRPAASSGSRRPVRRRRRSGPLPAANACRGAGQRRPVRRPRRGVRRPVAAAGPAPVDRRRRAWSVVGVRSGQRMTPARMASATI